jgi:ribosomal subunit interface protein
VDIVVKGRNVEVPDHYRRHIADKLHKVERYDSKIIECDVELSHERNPRQTDTCQCVQITCVSRGPVIRAEACAGDFYTALDLAVARLDHRLRRAADRRRVHRGQHAPVSVAAATAGLALDALPEVSEVRRSAATPSGVALVARPQGEPELGAATEYELDEERPGRIVRTKEHPADPMTVDDALFQMELVGHDFYLFFDKESGRPSVVYRRRAYDYGVISLAG